MKISYNWLKQYIDTDLEPTEIAKILTNTGLEVEGIETFESVRGGLRGVLIGEVKKVEKHPNAERLLLAEVDLGTGSVVPIVCGAPNVAEGQKVPVATVGTVLYNGDQPVEIKRSKIRGEVSEGMICAEDELGLGTSHEGIMVLDPDAQAGTQAKDYFKIETDTIYEIGLTPNRIDGASHFGVARDLAAYLNQFEPKKAALPSVADFSIDNEEVVIPVEILNPEACRRYSGITLAGVKVTASPGWLQTRLRSIGLTPINNVVDITNYVLHETGQPLHAFDADKITGQKVVVKTLTEGTPFMTLDAVERKLSSGDLMICNVEKPMCMAGVFGGIDSGVTNDTRSVFLESACFDPVFIRKTSRRHLLNTDASFRFERGTDPNGTLYALKRAALMIKEIAGAQISSPVQDIYPHKVEPCSVVLQRAHLDRLIGQEIPTGKVKKILESLDFEILEEATDHLRLEVPSYRVDVQREADVIEEILRIYGYNQVEVSHQVRSSMSYSSKPDNEKVTGQLAGLLSSRGFHEIMSNSLTARDYYKQEPAFDEARSVPLFNPLSQELNVLRQSLIFGGLEAIIYNLNRKRVDLKFFELGTCYSLKAGAGKTPKQEDYHEEKRLAVFVTGRKEEESWNADNAQAGFFYLKGVVHMLLERAGFSLSALEISEEPGSLFSEGLVYSIHDKELVRFGKVSEKTLKPFDIQQDVYFGEFRYQTLFRIIASREIQYEPMPKFPEVKRDLALLLDKGVQYMQIEELAFATEKKLLKSVHIFDVYTGEKIEKNKKSYAVSFILQDTQKTLTDKQIDKIMSRMIRAFQDQLGAVIR